MKIIRDDYSRLERISVNEGLSQSTIYSILQDSRGFMWFCTQQGLNRYDGYKFIVYKNDPSNDASIFNNYVTAITESRDKNLWLGMYDGSFCNYSHEDDSFTNYFIKGNAEDKSVKKIVICICEAPDGNLLIGTYGCGIKLFDKAKKEIRDFDLKGNSHSEKIKNISSLFSDDKGILWIGTWDEGLYRFDSKDQQLKKCNDNAGGKVRIENNIRCIFRDNEKNLWIGSANGLNKINANGDITETYLEEQSGKKIIVTCISEDKNKNLWLGTAKSGLYKLNLRDKGISQLNVFEIKDSGSPNSIHSLYTDRSNNLWLGTFTEGLIKLDCNGKKFFGNDNIYNGNQKLKSGSVNSIYKDKDGTVWLGTELSGLLKLNFNENNSGNSGEDSTAHKAFEKKSVICIHKADDDVLWIGTLTGLYSYDKKSNKVICYFYSSENENPVYSICRFSNNSDDALWIGTNKYGLLKFDKVTKKFAEYSSLKDFDKRLSIGIKCLYLDKSDRLWVGTDSGGLSCLDFEKGKIINFVFEKDQTATLSDNYVVSIYEDTNGNLWIGTKNGGLNKLEIEKQNFIRYSIQDGLPGNTVCGILEDERGNLWLSTNNGLCRFNPQKNTFRNYNIEDGLQSREFNDGAAFRDLDGYFYFGGVNGFNFFNPREITDNPYVPDIVIIDFQIFNHSIKNSPKNPFLKKNITETNRIDLTYRESVFSIEFAALGFNDPNKNQYSYKLEGFDKEWIYCGNRRFVTYTNLEPGEYIFRVRGSNNDGVWNPAGASLNISVSPPFWKTWWFKSMGVMSIMGVAGIAYRQKLSKVEKEKKSNEEFSRKLIESQENERKRISKGLHDTVAHDILITKNKAVIGLRKINDTEAVKNILNEISELTSGTLNDVRSISYDLHPPQIERLGLTKAIKSILQNVSQSTDIEFTESVHNIDNLLSKELEINLYRIIQECTSNIIKHSDAGKASFNLIRDNKTLVITIWDNGKGISKDRKGGSGLVGIAERIKLYKGELVIESSPSKGTLIAITLPI